MAHKQAVGHYKVLEHSVANKLPRYLPYGTYTDQNLRIWSYIKMTSIKKIDKNAENLDFYDEEDEYQESGTVKTHPVINERVVFGPYNSGYKVKINTTRDVGLFNKRRLETLDESVRKFVEKTNKQKVVNEAPKVIASKELEKPEKSKQPSKQDSAPSSTISSAASPPSTNGTSDFATDRSIEDRLRALQEAVITFKEERSKTEDTFKQYAEDIKTLQEENWELKDRIVRLEAMVDSMTYADSLAHTVTDVADDLHSLADTYSHKDIDDDVNLDDAIDAATVPPRPASAAAEVPEMIDSRCSKVTGSDDFVVVGNNSQMSTTSDDFVDPGVETVDESVKLADIIKTVMAGNDEQLKKKLVSMQKEMLQRIKDEMALIKI